MATGTCPYLSYRPMDSALTLMIAPVQSDKQATFFLRMLAKGWNKITISLYGVSIKPKLCAMITGTVI